MGKFAAFFLVLLTASQVLAWSNHFRLTQVALDSMKDLQQRQVLVSDFSDVVKNQAYLFQDLKTLSAYCQDTEAFDPKLSFNENLKINKTYVFKTEDVGQKRTAASLLIQFSDEPDWGMDQLLFTKDQYPQIWKKEYAFMGGSDPSDPVPTQAFRHMYWKAWSPSQPSATFKLPTYKSMGQAPDRAALFIALSRRAKEIHLDYWSLRFLANALHYLEDVSQPYHSVQTPTKEFWELPFTDKVHGDGFKGFVTQVTHIITFYHFNFEDYVALLLEKYFKSPGLAPEATPFLEALSQGSRIPHMSSGSQSFFLSVKELSSVAVGQGALAGRASIAFFPNLPPDAKFATFGGETSLKFMDDNYWAQVFKNGEGDSSPKKAYFSVVQTMFQELGNYVREAVKNNE